MEANTKTSVKTRRTLERLLKSPPFLYLAKLMCVHDETKNAECSPNVLDTFLAVVSVRELIADGSRFMVVGLLPYCLLQVTAVLDVHPCEGTTFAYEKNK